MPMNDDVRREIADGRSVFTPLISLLKGEPAEQTMDEARAAIYAELGKSICGFPERPASMM